MLILLVDNVVEFYVLVIFCLVLSPVAERGMLKSPTGIVDFAFCSLYSISFCFTYFVVLLYTHIGFLCLFGGLRFLSLYTVSLFPSLQQFPLL